MCSPKADNAEGRQEFPREFRQCSQPAASLYWEVFSHLYVGWVGPNDIACVCVC